MSEAALALELPSYEPPADLFELADRELEGRLLILYAGRTAVLDVLERATEEHPEYLLLRLESTPDRALEMLHHPWAFTTPENGRLIFDPPKFELVD